MQIKNISRLLDDSFVLKSIISGDLAMVFYLPLPEEPEIGQEYFLEEKKTEEKKFLICFEMSYPAAKLSELLTRIMESDRIWVKLQKHTHHGINYFGFSDKYSDNYSYFIQINRNFYYSDNADLIKNIIDIRLELDPCAAVRNNADAVNPFTAGMLVFFE